MVSRFRLVFALVVVSGFLPVASAPAFASLFSFGGSQQVRASLVALDESVQPGGTVTVAFKLEHAPRWHTYWINAGTGLPTTIAWELPEGWRAGEIQWPVPSPIKDHQGNITGNGYDDVVYLPVTLTAPANLAPGTTITLKGRADWLMCADVCEPGGADVSVTLPVLAAAPKPSALRAKVFATPPMPEKTGSARVTASRAPGAKSVTLVFSPSPVSANDAAPHFFGLDALIQYDQAQSAKIENGALSLTLPVSDSYDGDGRRLAGVLAFTDAKDVWRGYDIDVVIGDSDDAAGAGAGKSSATTAGASAGSAGEIAGTLLLAFVGGLILNLMPCVFPVLGIKILGFVNQAGASRRKVTLHGIAFTVGVLVSFWALAGLLAVLRAGGEQLGWGFQLQSPVFVFALAALLLIFAMSMSGVFEFGLSATSVGGGLQTKGGYAGSFFTGVLATVVATPCSAPFLAPALGAALAMSTGESFFVFTAIALGLSTPYLLLSIFPGAVKVLPRPGAWMETFKQAMAFPLYATVGYLVWVLAGQLSENGLLMALFAFVLVALGVWFYGRYAAPGNSSRRKTIGIAGALVCLLLGGLLGWPRAAAPTDIVWEKWSPAAVASAQTSGKTVYVDFTARWCATCQANKKLVFSSDEVNRVFRNKNIVALKADWTNKDAQITAELAKFGRSAVPFNLVYKPGEPEPVVLPELLTPGIVLDALK
ncbi:thioredoxin family protein [Ereboglobus sp. PH5-10]|uniref:protein-disulfide reductase DsbD family protein n=1 Tax=Ereboglobus sp. PH5-10 TaxID=2940629 RepID=UPI002406A704|nr:thioredoxin family protein [Ereboglobus sp. PH5-10]